MEIKANCKYDFDACKALTHLSMYKKANPKNQLILWSVLFLIFLSIIIFEIILFGVKKLLLVSVCIEIFCILLLYFFYFFMPKIQYNSLSKLKNIYNEYIFSDNFLNVISTSNEYNGEVKIEYSLFVKVYETSKYLFLYQTINQVFIVDKSTFAGGTAEQIRNILSSYLKKKYIVCKY